MLTLEEVKNDAAIRTYIQRADESLIALGFTEHSFPHVTMVAQTAGYILETLGYPARTGGSGPDCRVSPRHRESGQPH